MRFLGVFLVLCAIFSFVSADAVLAAGGEKKEEGGKEYVSFDPLTLPVIDSYGVQQVVSVVVSLEVDSMSNADKIKSMKPRLTDAYLMDMYGVMNENDAIKNGVVQVSIIKERLNRVTHDIMGDDLHAEVLLQVVQQRPI